MVSTLTFTPANLVRRAKLRKGRLMVAVQFATLAVLLFWPGKSISNTQALIGTLIEIFGGVLLILGFIHLKDSLKITPEPKENAEFVNTGIYKYIRHPIYSGLIFFGAGQVVSKWTLTILVAFIILVVDLVAKYRYEDSLLIKVYPGADEYQRRVGALLPKLRR